MDREARISRNTRGEKRWRPSSNSFYIYIYVLSVWEHPFRLIRMKELILAKACQVHVTVSGFVLFYVLIRKEVPLGENLAGQGSWRASRLFRERERENRTEIDRNCSTEALFSSVDTSVDDVLRERRGGARMGAINANQEAISRSEFEISC